MGVYKAHAGGHANLETERLAAAQANRSSAPRAQDAQVLTAILDRLDRLGFCVNRENSMLGEPQKCVSYLGMLIDTEKGVFIVPEDK